MPVRTVFAAHMPCSEAAEQPEKNMRHTRAESCRWRGNSNFKRILAEDTDLAGRSRCCGKLRHASFDLAEIRSTQTEDCELIRTSST